MGKSVPRDTEILRDLRQWVAEGSVHPKNLLNREGSGTVRDRLVTMVFNSMSALARLLPRRIGYGICVNLFEFIGWVAFPFRRNIKTRLGLALPKESRQTRNRVYREFWRDFGRTFFEILDHERFYQNILSRIEVFGAEHVVAAQNSAKPIVFVHAHQTNWEIILPVIKSLINQEICALYATLAIPQLHRRILHRRLQRGGGRFYPRHFRGSVSFVLKDLQAGHDLVVALDQRAPGKRYPFFGQPAKTTLVPIRLAQKTDAHLIPIDAERLNTTDKFRVTFHPNLLGYPTGVNTDPKEILSKYNELLEGWIKERPASWFWLHNRWE